MTHLAGRCVILMLAGLLCGCLERRMVISTDPPGALVFVNDHPIGPSPADYPFVYYGKYKITLVKDGFETQVVHQKVETPWYEYFPLDFVTENLVPYPCEDVHRFHYTLCPCQAVQPDLLMQDAEQLRNRGRGLPWSEGVTPDVANKSSGFGRKKRRRRHVAV